MAIEKDCDLVPVLREKLPGVTVVEADALEADWHPALVGQTVSVGCQGLTHSLLEALSGDVKENRRLIDQAPPPTGDPGAQR